MSTPRRQEKSTTALTSSTDKFVCMDLDGSLQDSIRLCLVSNRRQEHTHLLKCHSTVSLALSWARYTFEDRHRFFTPVSPVWAPCTPPRWPLFLSGAIEAAGSPACEHARHAGTAEPMCQYSMCRSASRRCSGGRALGEGEGLGPSSCVCVHGRHTMTAKPRCQYSRCRKGQSVFEWSLTRGGMGLGAVIVCVYMADARAPPSLCVSIQGVEAPDGARVVAH